MLICRNISKSFGPLVVMSEVSLTVGPGHRIGVLGPNGVGKSVTRLGSGLSPGE